MIGSGQRQSDKVTALCSSLITTKMDTAGIVLMVVAKHQRSRHRAAWMITHGEIPEGLLVLHKCDNPPCVKPEHLFLGTQQDNIKDMYAKDRGVVHKRQRDKEGKFV